MGSMGTFGTISSFQRRGYDAFYWKIDKMYKFNYLPGCYWRSPAFHFRGQKGNYLRLYTNGSNSENSGNLELYFMSDVNDSSSVHLTLGVKTKSGSIEKRFSINSPFLPQSREIGSILFKLDDFLKRKGELAPSDCVTFVLFLSRDALHIVRDVADRPITGQAEKDDVEKESEKKGGEKVLADMAKLLTSGNNSDATVIVKDSKFKVHSLILAARTPVFAALFEHDTLEKATRRVTITDCEPDVFEQFLKFVYTGSVQDLKDETSLRLYLVADKYLVKDLKEVCRRCIQDGLCTETFCEAVQLARKCGDNDLLESAIDFFATNVKDIIRSVEWQAYIVENPIEANEILIKAFGPP